jgi:hypothetical protein
MTLTLQPIRVATGFDEDGMMVLDRQRLVAVLVRLADDNEVAPGHWYLEAGFGRIDGARARSRRAGPCWRRSPEPRQPAACRRLPRS